MVVTQRFGRHKVVETSIRFNTAMSLQGVFTGLIPNEGAYEFSSHLRVSTTCNNTAVLKWLEVSTVLCLPNSLETALAPKAQTPLARYFEPVSNACF